MHPSSASTANTEQENDVREESRDLATSGPELLNQRIVEGTGFWQLSPYWPFTCVGDRKDIL
jgi:hypothetical protein